MNAYTQQHFRWHHILKGKFLEGKCNRRIDHLLYVLLCRVIDYYALRVGRELIGLEGPDLEVQRRQAIVESGLHIPAGSVQQKEDRDLALGQYLVKSESRADTSYLVDIAAYTCTCPDFPSISYCKHIFAVQRYFPSSDDILDTDLDDLDGSLENQVSESPAPKPLVDGSSLSESSSSPSSFSSGSLSSSSGTRDHRFDLVRKMETLSAYIRHNPSLDPLDVEGLECLIDKNISVFQDGSALLPTAKRLPPHLNSWPETRVAMMPPIKSRKKRAGDAYGAGEVSGKKAKKNDIPMASSSTTKKSLVPSSTPVPSIAVPSTQIVIPQATHYYFPGSTTQPMYVPMPHYYYYPPPSM